MPSRIRLQEKPPTERATASTSKMYLQYQNAGHSAANVISAREGGEVGMEGRKRVQTCAVTWWHTVAGDTGGVGVRLGRDLAQVPWGEPVRRAWPTRVRLLVQSQLHVIRHVG